MALTGICPYNNSPLLLSFYWPPTPFIFLLFTIVIVALVHMPFHMSNGAQQRVMAPVPRRSPPPAPPDLAVCYRATAAATSASRGATVTAAPPPPGGPPPRPSPPSPFSALLACRSYLHGSPLPGHAAALTQVAAIGGGLLFDIQPFSSWQENWLSTWRALQQALRGRRGQLQQVERRRRVTEAGYSTPLERVVGFRVACSMCA